MWCVAADNRRLHRRAVADGDPAEVMALPIVREIYLGVGEEDAA